MVFFVGRHAQQKGVKNLLYGFKKYRENGGTAKLVLGGKGHLTSSLKEFTSILNIEEDVVFEGFIPRQKLGDYYRCADAFISPSKSEPFGLTITEALEYKTPVIATESGVEEILEENNLVDIEPSSDSIAKGIQQGLKTEKEFNPVQRTWDEMQDEISEIYARCT